MKKISRYNERAAQRTIIDNIELSYDVFIFISTFIVVFIDFSYWIPAYTFVRLLLISLILVYMLMKMRVIAAVSDMKSSMPWIFFSGAILFSSYVHKSDYSTRNPFLAVIPPLVSLILFIFVLRFAYVKRSFDKLLNTFCWTGFIFLLITDVIIFSQNLMILGDKFDVAYFHILVFTIWMLKATKERKKDFLSGLFIFALFFFSIIVSIHVDCMTGVIGLVLVFVWSWLINRFDRLLCNPFFAVFLLIFSYLFMYLAPLLISNRFISRFIVFLNRDATLTGRTDIYSIVPQALQKSPFLGYGYGVSYEVLTHLGFGFIPDSQNGFAEWLLYGGWLTGCAFIFLMLTVIQLSQGGIKRVSYAIPAVAYIYAFISISAVEISFDFSFFAVLALLQNILQFEDISYEMSK